MDGRPSTTALSSGPLNTLTAPRASTPTHCSTTMSHRPWCVPVCSHSPRSMKPTRPSRPIAFPRWVIGTFEDGFNGQKHPGQFDSSLLQQFSQQPDITDVNTIEAGYHTTMKQRFNDYQNVQLNYHPKPADASQLPEALRGASPTADNVSQQNFNDAFSRKLQERNHLVTSLKSGPVWNQVDPTETNPQSTVICRCTRPLLLHSCRSYRSSSINPCRSWSTRVTPTYQSI